MVIKEGQRPPAFEENQESQDRPENGSKPKGKVIPLVPDFGRSAKVVGDWNSVPAHESPHEKNKRGELGKPLFTWYSNRTSVDALAQLPRALDPDPELARAARPPAAKEPEPEPEPEPIAAPDRPIDRLNLPTFQHPMWGKRP